MDQVQRICHPFHEHPLLAIQSKVEVYNTCQICEERLGSGPYLECQICGYSLHQWCAEQPVEIHHQYDHVQLIRSIEEQPLIERLDSHFKEGPQTKESLPVCNIFKVPNRLQETEAKPYEPYLISIGPYHRGNVHSQAMEVHKIHYLQNVIYRAGENSVTRYVSALKDLEVEARRCYAEPSDPEHDVLSRQEFIEMMLLDGIFVIELLRKSHRKKKGEKTEEIRKEVDCICSNFSMSGLARDLLLLENQLPFFVISELFRLTTLPTDQEKDLMRLALNCFSDMMPGAGLILNPEPNHRHSEFKTLLSSVECCLFSKKPDVGNFHPDRSPKAFLGLVHDFWRPSPDVEISYTYSDQKTEWNPIRNAKELEESGIGFKGIKRCSRTSMFDVKFRRRKMRMPTIKIEDDTDSILRNLIVYEQCHNHASHRYVTDYVTFMDCLINSEEDVVLLCRAEVCTELLRQ